MGSNLATAHVLLQCADPNHDACVDLRDELLKNCLEVKRASVVESAGHMRFCVRGISKIDPKRRQEFQEYLQEMGSPGARVSDAQVYVETG